MRLIVDMNLLPAWCAALDDAGWPAEHGSSVGGPTATDEEIAAWAEANGCVVPTQDLEVGRLLALTVRSGPSVVLLRGAYVIPEYRVARRGSAEAIRRGAAGGGCVERRSATRQMSPASVCRLSRLAGPTR